MLRVYFLSLVPPLLQLGISPRRRQFSPLQISIFLLLESRLLEISKNKHKPNQIILLSTVIFLVLEMSSATGLFVCLMLR